MTDARFERLRSLFDQATSLGEAERQAFVAAQRAADPELGEHLARLLACDTGTTWPRADDVVHPIRIPDHTILSRLGGGAMGTVYLAERTHPFHQRVAVKVLRTGAHGPEFLRRFATEREALAAMAHENIAKVLGGGVTEDGAPYLVMEWVAGATLTAHCHERRLPIGERIRLFQQVCEAVHHAHLRGVAHRDLKPGNVLVTDTNGHAVAKVIDFGLARFVEGEAARSSRLTGVGEPVGTLEYMAPEQLAADRTEVDFRVDVYSLGVMLYELLTGELPFASKRLRSATPGERHRIVQHEEPPAPSRRRALHADLDWIVLKAMAKDQARRYSSAAALRDDLTRHLAHTPIEARPPSAVYRLQRFVRRHRLPCAAGLVVGLTLAVGVAGTTLGFVAAERRLDEFEQLAGLTRIERLQEEARRLVPSWPEHIPALRRWLIDAEAVFALDGRVALALSTLEARALAPAGDPPAARQAELRRASAQLAAARHADAVRRGAPLQIPAPSAFESAMSARQLNKLVWPRVDSDDALRVFGDERHALALAQLAWQKAAAVGVEEALVYGDSLAWALFANGRDADAIAQAEQTVARAPQRRRAEYAESLTTLRGRVAAAAGTEGAAAIAGLEARVAELARRDDLRFANEADTFMYGALRDFRGRVAALRAKQHATVVGRLAWAERVDEVTLRHPGAGATWEEVRVAIAEADGVRASALYRDHPIDLRPQTGLVPIGRNPVTLLFEFYDLRSAWDGVVDPRTLPIPRHAADGKIAVGDGTGMVFVLVPGGTFLMGAQPGSPAEPNHDPLALDGEAPVHAVTLAPFFLARHELTRGQWRRLSGEPDPSAHRVGTHIRGDPEPISQSHPVSMLRWLTVDALFGAHGLRLPTEAQWEYACRAGATTPWHTGSDAASLTGFANLLDVTSATINPAWGNPEGGLVDGWASPAPVGTFAANTFGLHDMHGNVSEWCADRVLPFGGRVCDGDGLRLDAGPGNVYVIRGAGNMHPARIARSASRLLSPAVHGEATLGARAARPLQR